MAPEDSGAASGELRRSSSPSAGPDAAGVDRRREKHAQGDDEHCRIAGEDDEQSCHEDCAVDIRDVEFVPSAQATPFE